MQESNRDLLTLLQEITERVERANEELRSITHRERDAKRAVPMEHRPLPDGAERYGYPEELHPVGLAPRPADMGGPSSGEAHMLAAMIAMEERFMKTLRGQEARIDQIVKGHVGISQVLTRVVGLEKRVVELEECYTKPSTDPSRVHVLDPGFRSEQEEAVFFGIRQRLFMAIQTASPAKRTATQRMAWATKMAKLLWQEGLHSEGAVSTLDDAALERMIEEYPQFGDLSRRVIRAAFPYHKG